MTTSPTSKIPQLSRQVSEEIEQATAGALGSLTLRQLLGLMLSTLGEAERKAFLAATTDDKGNGKYDRSVAIGSFPIDVHVPRTRSGDFRPSWLPARYQRAFPEEMAPLLLELLLSSRSINAAKAALSRLGLPLPEKDLEAIASELIEELDLRNTRPIEPDLIAVFLDGKYVEIKDQDRLRPTTIYVVVGLGRDGKKTVLACLPRPGRESLEEWKKILRSLIERGLRRVLVVVQDDFSGLLPVTKGLFPHADVQLCIVHMQRNAKSHFPKEHASQFTQRIRTLMAAWDFDVGAKLFDDLCDDFSKLAPTFIDGIRKKRDHYLAFLRYPNSVRRPFSTTNAVEAINGQLEKIRLNSGGYFHSEAILKLKLGAAVLCLERDRWLHPAASVAEALHQLNVMFQSRFESEASL